MVGGGLENLLNRLLCEYEEAYGITEKDATISGGFSVLIRRIHSLTGKRVAILVDEYDKPLLGIEENPELFERNQVVLKVGIYKAVDTLLIGRFALVKY